MKSQFLLFRRLGGFDGNPQYQQFSAPVQTQQLPQQQHTVYLPQMSPQMAHQLQQLQQCVFVSSPPVKAADVHATLTLPSPLFS